MCFDSVKLVIGYKNTLLPICKFHFIINYMMIAGAESGFFFFLNNWKVILSEILRFQSQSPVFCVALPVLLWVISFYFFFRAKHTQTQNSLLSVHKECLILLLECAVGWRINFSFEGKHRWLITYILYYYIVRCSLCVWEKFLIF